MLVYDVGSPEGRVYATGLRNCVALGVQPAQFHVVLPALMMHLHHADGAGHGAADAAWLAAGIVIAAVLSR